MFFTTRIAIADAIFRDGFTDIYEFGGCEGVYFADRQLDVNDGFEVDVTLCMDAPDEVFERHEVIEDGAAGLWTPCPNSCRRAQPDRQTEGVRPLLRRLFSQGHATGNSAKRSRQPPGRLSQCSGYAERYRVL